VIDMTDDVRLITMTVGYDMGRAIDVHERFRSLDSDKLPVDVVAIAIVSPHEHDILVKRNGLRTDDMRIRVGKIDTFKNHMTVYVSTSARACATCRMYASGKLHLVGVKSFDQAHAFVRLLHGIAAVDPPANLAINVYMTNVGFDTHVHIDRPAACRMWNAQSCDAHATLNTERYAALKIRMKTPTCACIMAFRTGKVQITGKLDSWDAIHRVKRVWDEFVASHGRHFIMSPRPTPPF
jgi:TATA-box binding protein (TBP) (component of TFIID and TFIIIB)